MDNKQVDNKQEFLKILEKRFMANHLRHPGIFWGDVQESILHEDRVLGILQWMEETGGEPDVIGFEEGSNAYLICDCSKESPNRRSLCYDQNAREERKQNKPVSSAWEETLAHGAKLMNEEEYLLLQSRNLVDLKSSSWLDTPPAVRDLGGALFGDARYGRVFVYHNRAESYFAGRGFRVIVRVK